MQRIHDSRAPTAVYLPEHEVEALFRHWTVADNQVQHLGHRKKADDHRDQGDSVIKEFRSERCPRQAQYWVGADQRNAKTECAGEESLDQRAATHDTDHADADKSQQKEFGGTELLEQEPGKWDDGQKGYRAEKSSDQGRHVSRR